MESRVLFVSAPRIPGKPVPPASVPPDPALQPAGLRGASPSAVEHPERGSSGPLDARVDGPALARALETALAPLLAEGFRLVQLLPVTSGAYAYGGSLERHFEGWASAASGFGFGFSYTEGLLARLER